MTICSGLYLALSVVNGHLLLCLKIVPADYHVYCDTSWKWHSKFYVLHSSFFLHLSHIHRWISHHWPDKVKFLQEFDPFVQFWGNTQTYNIRARSVTSAFFFIYGVFPNFSMPSTNSFRNLSSDMCTASSKASSPQCDLVLHLYIKYPLFSLRSSSSCLRLLPRLPVTSFLPSGLPSFVLLRVGCSCPFCRYAVLHFSHGLSKGCSPSLLVYYPLKIKRIRQILFPATVSSNKYAVHCYALCLS